MVSEEIKNPRRYATSSELHSYSNGFFYVLSFFFSLQEYSAQHSSRGAVRHDDLRSDERVLLDRPVGRRNDFGSRRSSCKYTRKIMLLLFFFFSKREFNFLLFFFYQFSTRY